MSAASLNAKNSPSAACVRALCEGGGEVRGGGGRGGGGGGVICLLARLFNEGGGIGTRRRATVGARDPSALIRGQQQLRRGEQQGDVPSIT